MKLLWFILGSYLMGSFPTAALVADKIKNLDIFKSGSRNPGASNVFRLMGFRWALLVLTVDMLKGYLPVRLTEEWLQQLSKENPQIHPETIKALVGLAAVSGHIFPITTRFKGGKGAATIGGVLVALAPTASSISLLVWAIVLYVLRKFSLASLAASITFPFAVYVFEGKRTLSSLGWGMLVPLLLTATHRENIRRLRKGDELPVKLRMEREDG